MVHSLEDGGVVINYRSDLDPAMIGQLTAVVNSYASDHLIMAPYPGLTKPIVLTAWGRIDQLDTLDEARVRRFAMSGEARIIMPIAAVDLRRPLRIAAKHGWQRH